MSELTLNLQESATRAALVAQLEAGLAADVVEAVKAAVQEAGVPERHHHDLAEILATVDALQASDWVKERMAVAYRALNAAEASVHGVPEDQAHFHEVGRAAGIRNALHVCLLAEAQRAAGVERIVATPLQMGSGTVHIAHGQMSVPAPATAAILRTGLPVCAERLEGELCTPTSAALIKALVDDFVTEGVELGEPPAAPTAPVPEHGGHEHAHEHEHVHAHSRGGHDHDHVHSEADAPFA